MYAPRYTGSSRFNPGGLVAAIGINGGVVAALMLVAPYVTHKPPAPPLIGEAIELQPLPPEPTPPPRTEARVEPRPTPPIDAPRTIVEHPAAAGQVTVPESLVPALPADGGVLGGTGTGVEPRAIPTPAAPVIVAPGIDPRYAGDFQPLYPAGEQRMGRSGKVTVRVLIGTDGRVKQVEPVSATSDAFLRATTDQAKRRWRFTPGTRDGVAQEAWRVMTVTFVLQE